MHILKTFLIALGGLFVVALTSNAAETAGILDNRHMFLSRIMFVLVGALFVVACGWRLFHADDHH